jgi:hypothetical protein
LERKLIGWEWSWMGIDNLINYWNTVELSSHYWKQAPPDDPFGRFETVDGSSPVR